MKNNKMVNECFYYYEDTNKIDTINFHTLNEMEKSDTTKFLKIKKQLYLFQDKTIPMVMVRKGNHKGFKRKGFNTCSKKNEHYNGKNESPTHKYTKEIFKNLKEFSISFNGELVKIYAKENKIEETVRCYNRYYRVDLLILLEKTEPREYFEKWKGKLWFEVCDTCPVDDKQAVDFELENICLFEYKIYDNFRFLDNITPEEVIKQKKYLLEKYRQCKIEGHMFWQHREINTEWKECDSGALVSNIDGIFCRIIYSKFGKKCYVLFIGDDKPREMYNKRKFSTVEDAKKAAELIVYNKKKRNKVTSLYL